jgi:hypothetical protein
VSDELTPEQRGIAKAMDLMAREGLRRLQRQVEEWSRAKGWYDREVPVPESIALLHTEASEMMEAHRMGAAPKDRWYTWDKGAAFSSHPFFHGERDEMGKPEGIGPELADIVIRALDFASRHGLDLAELVDEKMAHNWTRPHRHGEKAA